MLRPPPDPRKSSHVTAPLINAAAEKARYFYLFIAVLLEMFDGLKYLR